MWCQSCVCTWRIYREHTPPFIWNCVLKHKSVVNQSYSMSLAQQQRLRLTQSLTQSVMNGKSITISLILSGQMDQFSNWLDNRRTPGYIDIISASRTVLLHNIMRVVMREAGEEKGVCQSVCLTAGATPPSELFGAEVALSVLPHEYGSVKSGVDSKALFKIQILFLCSCPDFGTPGISCLQLLFYERRRSVSQQSHRQQRTTRSAGRQARTKRHGRPYLKTCVINL